MSATQDPLPGYLRQWAEWYEALHASGYSDSSTLWRALFGLGAGQPQSMIPRGVDSGRLDGPVQRVADAIDALVADPDPKIHEPVNYVRAFYLFGYAKVVAETGLSTAALYNMVRLGEGLIRVESRLR